MFRNHLSSSSTVLVSQLFQSYQFHRKIIVSAWAIDLGRKTSLPKHGGFYFCKKLYVNVFNKIPLIRRGVQVCTCANIHTVSPDNSKSGIKSGGENSVYWKCLEMSQHVVRIILCRLFLFPRNFILSRVQNSLDTKMGRVMLLTSKVANNLLTWEPMGFWN